MSQSTEGHHAYELYEQRESNVQTHARTHSGWHRRRAKNLYIPSEIETHFHSGERRNGRTCTEVKLTSSFCCAIYCRWDGYFYFQYGYNRPIRANGCVWVYTFHVEHVKFVCHTTREIASVHFATSATKCKHIHIPRHSTAHSKTFPFHAKCNHDDDR